MPELDVKSEIRKNTLSHIYDFVSGIKTDPYIPPVTDWAAGNRYLPSGSTERPGRWDAGLSSYTVEIQENLHRDSPIRITSTLKSAQSMLTTMAENVIGHSIEYGLHNILYIISDIALARIRSSFSIDVMIDRSGLAGKIRPVAKRVGQRKTADTVLYKELFGGRRLLMTSYNCGDALDSLSWDFIIMDELDKAPPELKGIGDPEGIIEARGKTIRKLKVLKLSTPSIAGRSRIYRAFKTGDQREYMVPCPRCGGFQFLEFMKEERKYGLYGDYTIITGKKEKKVSGTAGLYGDKTKEKIAKRTLIEGSERYKCKLCGKDFYDDERYERSKFMIEKSLGGEAYWQPFAAPVDKRDRSYHISAMMSPMTRWENILSDFAKSNYGKNINMYRNFIITNEGLPYFNKSVFKSWEILKKRAEKYERGTPPEGVLLLTAGVDVQKDRLELQVIGWGYGMEAWSIDHLVFKGVTANVNSIAWQQLLEYCDRYFKMPGIKSEMCITKVGIDASYNPNKDYSMADVGLRMETDAVYAFCSRNVGRYVPIRGIEESDCLIVQRRHKAYGLDYYHVDVSAIKDELFANIERKRGAYSLHFTKDYSDDFFKQFLSEARKEGDDGRTRYVKINARNETLDTYVYARACMNIIGADRWSDEEWEVWKESIM
jgi:phage terminase large subunit GpA-like protein